MFDDLLSRTRKNMHGSNPYVGLIVVLLPLFICQFGFGQKKPVTVGLTLLHEEPQKFKDTLVEVQGFITFEFQPRHAPVVLLYPNQEGAKAPLATGNGTLVIPNQEMLRNHEKIDHRNVRLIGVFRAVPAIGGSYGTSINDIRDCSEVTATIIEPKTGIVTSVP